jgi:ankyrin repeat protein
MDGNTPFTLAIQFGHKNIKELLLEYGATLDETKKAHNTNLRSLR